MKLVLDSSVWIDHLRDDALEPLLPRLRGRYQMWMSGVVAAELVAGVSSRSDRRVVDRLLAPFGKARRILPATSDDLLRSGRALSRLSERGVSLTQAGAALLEAVIAVTASRSGALLVSANAQDFEKLVAVMPLRFEAWDDFRSRINAR